MRFLISVTSSCLAQKDCSTSVCDRPEVRVHPGSSALLALLHLVVGRGLVAAVGLGHPRFKGQLRNRIGGDVATFVSRERKKENGTSSRGL